ncbi:hypothetical protein ACN267_31300 [Micromonospora sp. WMMD734]|uniref:hypothetical protein n=1 Tax=Micromonospora sp. WMMD734 TaxID=3404129 RepID=UPI003B952217
MRFEFRDVAIEFVDGEQETVSMATREYISDGVLHLFQKNGEYAPETHMGSYPLANIRKWKRTER